MHWFSWRVVLPTVAAGLTMLALAQHGTVTDIVVHGPGLEDNLLGDAADRAVSIYLPPEYERTTSTRYPVLYLLHGNGDSNRTWVDGFDAADAADTLIASGAMQPLIIVMPNVHNAYGHSYCVNSPVSGNWDDFVTKDLVAYVDAHYRTLAQPASRAVAGHSAGGYSALYLATRHADIFRVVYAINPAPVGFATSEAYMEMFAFAVLGAAAAVPENGQPMRGLGILSMAVAFSPNAHKPPAYVDFPFERVDGRPKRIDAVWARWVAHMPLGMIDSYASDLREYAGIAIDMATNDLPDFVRDAQAYSEALAEAGIRHRFQLYEGGHDDVTARLRSALLPYVSTKLASAPAQAGHGY